MQNTEQQSSARSKSQEGENPSTFKRLMSYAKAYKKGFIAAVIGMLGYAAVDSFVLSQLQPLIDEGLTGENPNFMQWAPLFIIVMFIRVMIIQIC